MCVDYAPPLLPLDSKGQLPDFDKCFPVGAMLEPALRDLARFGYVFYGAYLLKCPPLLDGELRKPTKYELTNCFAHLQAEIAAYQPAAVLLLGQRTYMNALALMGLTYRKSQGYYFGTYSHGGVNFAAIPHPGTLDRLRDNIGMYMEGITSAVRRCAER